MRRPDPTWQTEYRCDQRKHRHRCRCCKAIIQPGDQVVMARVATGGRFATKTKTVAMHTLCADLPWLPGNPQTGREVMNHWGLEGLAKAGWNVPELATTQ